MSSWFRYFLEQSNEATIFPASFGMAQIYTFYLRLGVSFRTSTCLRQDASLRTWHLIRICAYLGSAQWWWNFPHFVLKVFNDTSQSVPHWPVRVRSEEKSLSRQCLSRYLEVNLCTVVLSTYIFTKDLSLSPIEL